MDTVSYLTINDETKEIADITSRDNIENIAATIAAHGDDIEYIQLETGPGGAIANSINDAYVTAFAAQSAASAAVEAASIADEKATSAGQAASSAWSYANDASEAAQEAWNRAGDAADAALAADAKADLAGASANAAQASAENAASAASTAWDKASDAADAALIADTKAEAASASAQAAQNSATEANTYAVGALTGLSTLESVIDTVNWFADHRTQTTDIVVDSNKNYYTYDEETGTMSKVEPWGVENPAEEGWYELDETIQNYVVSHVAETDDGLYVLSTISGWRVLVSTGGGNYAPGVFIVNPQGVIKQAMTGEGISFDNSSPFSIGDEDAYIVFDGNGHITIGGDGVEIYSPITVGNSRKTLSEVLNDLGHAITSIQYGVGNFSNTHVDIVEWSNDTPEWQPGKYIWMRTTTNGLTYTYTCIQGVQGPKGETGPRGETGAPGAEGIGILSVETSYAISDSDEVIPEDDMWKSSIEQWYSYYDYEEGETGYTGYIDEIGYTGYTGYIDETGDTGEDFIEEDVLVLEQGKWLWIRTETTYTDFTSSVTYQKSYVGTDGQDGKSVFIQSTSRDDETGITTIILEDSDGNTETIEIHDGQDGTNGIPGQPGEDGRTFYTHFAWADDIVIDDSTTPPTVTATGFDRQDSLNKLYIGVYSDENIEDSTHPEDYSWTLIKGETGETGDTGEQGPPGQDSIRVEIDPIGGNFIRRGQVGTSLIAHVYEGINDITNQFSHFTWYRRKADGTRDTSWSTQETSNQLSITTADIDETAVFVCEVTVTR